jgi:hypothetical protein
MWLTPVIFYIYIFKSLTQFLKLSHSLLWIVSNTRRGRNHWNKLFQSIDTLPQITSPVIYSYTYSVQSSLTISAFNNWKLLSVNLDTAVPTEAQIAILLPSEGLFHNYYYQQWLVLCREQNQNIRTSIRLVRQMRWSELTVVCRSEQKATEKHECNLHKETQIIYYEKTEMSDNFKILIKIIVLRKDKTRRNIYNVANNQRTR